MTLTSQNQLEYKAFDASGYLKEYYSAIGAENQFLIDMLAKAYCSFDDDSLTILEVGGGPTVYQLVSAAKKAKDIHFTDYSNNNLAEIKKWVSDEHGSYNWDAYIAAGLNAENVGASQEAVKLRKDMMRSKITQILEYDLLGNTSPETGLQVYDLVSSIFSTDAIVHSLDEWKTLLGSVGTLVADRGWLILVGVLGSSSWTMAGQTFKATNLSKNNILEVLGEIGFNVEMFETTPAEADTEHGYDGIFVLKARKR